MNKRNQRTPNEIIISDNVAEIILYNVRAEKKSQRAVVDADDVEKIKTHKWCLGGDGYVMTHLFKTKSIKLHHMVYGKPLNNKVIDHKDGNPLNNCKSNLQIITNAQNIMKHKVYSNNSSGFTGIYKRRNKWIAQIKFKGEVIYLGIFQDIDEAIKKRKEAERKYFGLFAS